MLTCMNRSIWVPFPLHSTEPALIRITCDPTLLLLLLRCDRSLCYHPSHLAPQQSHTLRLGSSLTTLISPSAKAISTNVDKWWREGATKNETWGSYLFTIYPRLEKWRGMHFYINLFSHFKQRLTTCLFKTAYSFWCQWLFHFFYCL